MKKLIFKFAIIVSINIIIFSPYIITGVIGIFTGELRSVDFLIKYQINNHNCLVGMAYNEHNPYYKKTTANYYKKEVIALGTSRVMQFSSEYFFDNFYNCGGGVSSNFNEYTNFLMNLNYTPQVIILGLDQWIFNYAWSGESKEFSEFVNIESPKELIFKIHQITKMFFKDFILGKWTLKTLKTFPMNMGLNGKVRNNGFLWDGTYYYGELYLNPTKTEEGIHETLERIMAGGYRFECGQEISEITLKQLQKFLEYCKVNNIKVIAFLPPFAPTAYASMIKSGNYGYLNQLFETLKPIFNFFEYDLFDFSDGALLGFSDAYFLDGFHGSEIVYNFIAQEFIKNSDILDNYIDENKLFELYYNRFSELVSREP